VANDLQWAKSYEKNRFIFEISKKYAISDWEKTGIFPQKRQDSTKNYLESSFRNRKRVYQMYQDDWLSENEFRRLWSLKHKNWDFHVPLKVEYEKVNRQNFARIRLSEVPHSSENIFWTIDRITKISAFYIRHFSALFWIFGKGLTETLKFSKSCQNTEKSAPFRDESIGAIESWIAPRNKSYRNKTCFFALFSFCCRSLDIHTYIHGLPKKVTGNKKKMSWGHKFPLGRRILP
jgi:hypothetical protein